MELAPETVRLLENVRVTIVHTGAFQRESAKSVDWYLDTPKDVTYIPLSLFVIPILQLLALKFLL